MTAEHWRPAAAERWLVALDIDGTLLHEDGTKSQAVVDAVRAVEAAGHMVVLATGRSELMTVDVVDQFQIESPYLVSANGALVLRREGQGYARIHTETFDATEVLERIRGHMPDGRFMVEDVTGFRRYTEGMVEWNLVDAIEVPFERLAEEPATRVVVMSPDTELDDFLELVETMGLHRVSYAIGFSSWLDIAPEGVNKATGLQHMLAASGVDIPRERILAIGDGRNDIDMFEWVAAGGGRAVSMGQAPPEVHAAANERTDVVDADGAVPILRSIL